MLRRTRDFDLCSIRIPMGHGPQSDCRMAIAHIKNDDMKARNCHFSSVFVGAATFYLFLLIFPLVPVSPAIEHWWELAHVQSYEFRLVSAVHALNNSEFQSLIHNVRCSLLIHSLTFRPFKRVPRMIHSWMAETYKFIQRKWSQILRQCIKLLYGLLTSQCEIRNVWSLAIA